VLQWQLLTFVAITGKINKSGVSFMSSTLNVQLTNELRRYIDMRASDDDVYATPSEYIRDLVRRDMEEFAIVSDVVQGLREMKAGTFAKESILDILNES
jgi:antitoxin ParD1/3/4